VRAKVWNRKTVVLGKGYSAGEAFLAGSPAAKLSGVSR